MIMMPPPKVAKITNKKEELGGTHLTSKPFFARPK
jgi:hypothetical protein